MGGHANRPIVDGNHRQNPTHTKFNLPDFTKVELIRQGMKATQGRKKSYVDKQRKELEFEVWDMVFLKVFPF